MSQHLKLHSFTGTSDHDFTGLVTDQIIKYDGTNVISSDTVSSLGVTNLSGGTILSGGTDLYNIFGAGGGETLAQTLAIGNDTSGNTIIVSPGDYLGYSNSGFINRIITTTINTNRTHTLQNKTGTLAHLDDDSFVTGGTFNTGTTAIDLSGDGPSFVDFSVDLSALSASLSGDTYITGGTVSYTGSEGTLTLGKNNGVLETITGFTDVNVTGGTFNTGTTTLDFTSNNGSFFSVPVSGITSSPGAPNRGIQFNDNGNFAASDALQFKALGGSGYFFNEELLIKSQNATDSIGIFGMESDGTTPAFAIGYNEASNQSIFFFNNVDLNISNAGPAPLNTIHHIDITAADSLAAKGGEVRLVSGSGSGATPSGDIWIRPGGGDAVKFNDTTVSSRTGATTGDYLALAADGSIEYVTHSGVSGSGTTNTIPMWNGTETLTDSIMTYDGTSGITVAGDVFIAGNFEVLGTATTINTQDLYVVDNTITLNSGGTAISATNGGIIIQNGVNNGTDASWTIDANGNWQTDNGITSSAMTVSNGNLNVTGGGVMQSGGTDLYSIFTTAGSDLTTASNGLTKTGYDVKLGGALSAPTTVDLSGNAISFTGSTAASALLTINNGTTINNAISVTSVGAGLTAQNDTAGLSSGILATSSGTIINADDSADVNSLSILSDGTLEIDDSINSKGIDYAANYHVNYTPRTLVDKEYVDNHAATGVTTSTASNGLTKTGNNITLGGALTGDTTVTTGANGLYADAGATGNILFSGNGGSFTQISLENSQNPTIPASVNVGKGVATMLSKSGTTTTGISNGGLQASMYYENAASNQRSIVVSDSQMFIQDDIDSKGIDYADNYHANYTPRTLVDKEYVDNNIATGVTGFVTGSGTDNTVPLWNGTTALDNSILSQAGSVMTAAGDMIVTGDFTVNGTTTTIDSQTLRTADNNIEMNLSGNNISANGGGLTVLSGVSNSIDATWQIDATGNWAANAGIQGTTVTATEFFAMAPYTGSNPASPSNNDAWFHSGATGTITLNYRVGGTNFAVELS